MLTTYHIFLGDDRVAVRDAGTALLALIEYLTEAGCSDGDIVRLGPASVSWMGAVYRAEPSQA